MRRIITTLVAALVAVLGIPAAASAQETGTVTVVHAVPDVTVDVYVNGDLTLEDFAPRNVTDPLELPAGDYQIDIRAAGADAGDDPVISGSASLPGGANASIVAHLTEDGDPTLGVFVNDVSQLEAGQSRLTVRHTAAAPAVDIWADGSPLITDLANPDEAGTEVPAGTYEVAVAPTGTEDPVIGPTDLTLEEGTSTIVYAFGSVDEGLDVLIQTISGLHGAPHGVPSGTGGQAATGLPMGWILVTLLAAAGAAGATRRLATVRDR
jgi:hypothetical protein